MTVKTYRIAHCASHTDIVTAINYVAGVRT